MGRKQTATLKHGVDVGKLKVNIVRPFKSYPDHRIQVDFPELPVCYRLTNDEARDLIMQLQKAIEFKGIISDKGYVEMVVTAQDLLDAASKSPQFCDGGNVGLLHRPCFRKPGIVVGYDFNEVKTSTQPSIDEDGPPIPLEPIITDRPEEQADAATGA